MLDLEIALQPKQDDLWSLVDESPFIDIGYGGRRGGGKSGGMRRILLLRRLKYARTNGLIIRRTYDELYKNHIEPLWREYPIMQDWWVDKHKSIVFPNGSKLFFGYAEHEKDVDKFVGSEFGDICAEEAGLFSKRELQKLKGSCRWTGNTQFTPKMLYSFMPQGLSHFYLKRIFIDREYEATEDPAQFAFVEAYGWDNVEWCRKLLAADGLTDKDFYRWSPEQRKQYFLKSDYAKVLLSLDEDLRAAWLDGSWEKFEGIVFPMLSEKVHDLDRFQLPFIPRRCKLISAVDWADSGTTAATQSAFDEADNMMTFDEYCKPNRLVSEHTHDILAMLNGHGPQEYTLMDLPVNNINQADLMSIQKEFKLAGLNTVAAHRANIEMGLNLLKEMLKVDPKRRHPFTGQMGSPRLFISKSKCPMAWQQMKELQKIVDVDTGKVKYIGRDDSLDTVRYKAMSRPKPVIVPEEDLSPDEQAALRRIEHAERAQLQ